MASRGQIQIDVVADTTKVDDKLSRELKTIVKGLKLQSVPIGADASNFAADVKKKLKSSLGKAKPAQIPVTPDVDGFVRDANGKLRDAKGRFVPVTVPIGADTTGFTRDVNGKLRDAKGRFVTAGKAAGEGFGTGAVGGIRKSFGSALSSAMQSASKTASSAAATLGTTLGVAVIAALAPVIIGGISSVITVAAALGAGAAIIGIGALALKGNERLVAEAKSTVETIKQVFAEAAAPLIEPFSEALTEVRRLVKSLAPDFKALFAGIAPSVRALTSALGPTLKPILDGLKKSLPGINAAFTGLAKGLVILGNSIGKFFTTIFKDGPVVQAMTKNLFAFAAALLDVLGPAIRVTSVLFSAFVNLGRASAIGWTLAWEQIKKAFDGGSGAISRLTAAWAPLKQAIMAVWDALKQFAAADTNEEIALSMVVLVQKIKDAWGPLKDFLSVVWDEAWAFIKRVWSEKVVPWWEGTVKPYLTEQIKEFVANVFSSMVSEAVGFLASLPGRAAAALAGLGSSIRGAVLGAVAGAASWLYNAGRDVIQGLINGITSRIGGIADAVSRIAQSIPSTVRKLLDSNSPSRVMMRVGADTVQGLTMGMSSQEEQMRRQVANIAASMTPVPVGAVRGGDGASMQTAASGVRVWPSQPPAPDSTPTIVIESVGQDRLSQLLVEILQYGVRVRGGDVQKVLGRSSGGVR